ncbi:MAG TPA: RNA polymerase sigma factor [Cyclobacteriaceae bacterium]|nr:RNA polymerase sigma factor [Cyclobacteriaceae bacterium]HPW61531.1 RNA polymerase sigma factor [Cyclobacteriaceae bacterium]
MTEQVEQEVIRKAMAGNTDAFRVIVDHYQSFAYSVSFRFLGQAEEAEDIVQESFIRLWKNMHRYRSEVKLSTWLYRIITNLCLDYLKSTYARQQKNLKDVQTEYMLKSQNAADEELNAKELNEQIQHAAAELTPKQKAVFILRDLEGLPVEEVCNILSMSAGNVKGNLYYARQHVGTRLKKYYQMDKITIL